MMWREAIEELPDDVRDRLQPLYIHDSRDRMAIEEIVAHEVPEEHYPKVADAFHQLKQEFDYE